MKPVTGNVAVEKTRDVVVSTRPGRDAAPGRFWSDSANVCVAVKLPATSGARDALKSAASPAARLANVVALVERRAVSPALVIESRSRAARSAPATLWMLNGAVRATLPTGT